MQDWALEAKIITFVDLTFLHFLAFFRFIVLKHIDFFFWRTSSLCGRRRGTESEGRMQDWVLEAKKNRQDHAAVFFRFYLHPWFLSSFLLQALSETDLEIPISSAKHH